MALCSRPNVVRTWSSTFSLKRPLRFFTNYLPRFRPIAADNSRNGSRRCRRSWIIHRPSMAMRLAPSRSMMESKQWKRTGFPIASRTKPRKIPTGGAKQRAESGPLTLLPQKFVYLLLKVRQLLAECRNVLLRAPRKLTRIVQWHNLYHGPARRALQKIDLEFVTMHANIGDVVKCCGRASRAFRCGHEDHPPDEIRAAKNPLRLVCSQTWSGFYALRQRSAVFRGFGCTPLSYAVRGIIGNSSLHSSFFGPQNSGSMPSSYIS
jgi:hypothetical protein